MNSISEYIIAIFELAEAEGRTLKQEMMKLLLSFVLLLVFAFFLITAYLFLMYGLHTYFTSFMSGYAAGFLLSGISLLIALSILVLIKWKL